VRRARRPAPARAPEMLRLPVPPPCDVPPLQPLRLVKSSSFYLYSRAGRSATAKGVPTCPDPGLIGCSTPGGRRGAASTDASVHFVRKSDSSSETGGPVARRQPKTRDTRERVAAAALEVFSERGYAAASIDDIVERAGTTRGAFYYYFEGKDDVARDLQRDLWHRLANEAQASFDPALDTI